MRRPSPKQVEGGFSPAAFEVTLAAFDLIELQSDDLRDEPLSKRKQRLAKILGSGPDAIVYNEHLDHDGVAVFEHACRMGLEGIVSKRLDSPYQSGPSKTWLKSKNPLSEAVRRERERGATLRASAATPPLTERFLLVGRAMRSECRHW